MALLEVHQAGFSYGGQTGQVFHDISFQVESGQVFCLLGANGSGKTTLLDCILGINKLQTGSIVMQGIDTQTLQAGRLAKHIAYVPQRHENSFPYTVIEMVKMGRTAYTGRFEAPSQEDKNIAKQALNTVGLLELRHRPFTHLSGGESQMVLIARALAQRTPLIIMDEPTAHLDFRHELIVLETIAQLVREEGLAVVMATHRPNHIFYFENQHIPVHVALIHRKNLLASGSAAQVVTEANMARLYGVKARLLDFQVEKDHFIKQMVAIGTLPKEEPNHE